MRSISPIWYRAGALAVAGLCVGVAFFAARNCADTNERPAPTIAVSNSALVRTDGNIVEVVDRGYARPNATTVPLEDVSFPWARSPLNKFGAGPCRDPYFKLTETPLFGHTYAADEVMTVGVQYSAPGCKNMIITLAGRHRADSPWYTHWCNDVIHEQLNAPDFDCGAWLPSDFGRHAALTADTGVVVFESGPGHTEGLLPGDQGLTIEGFQLCVLVIRLDDGIPDGSVTSQQVELGCDRDSKAD